MHPETHLEVFEAQSWILDFDSDVASSRRERFLTPWQREWAWTPLVESDDPQSVNRTKHVPFHVLCWCFWFSSWDSRTTITRSSFDFEQRLPVLSVVYDDSYSFCVCVFSWFEFWRLFLLLYVSMSLMMWLGSVCESASENLIFLFSKKWQRHLEFGISTDGIQNAVFFALLLLVVLVLEVVVVREEFHQKSCSKTLPSTLLISHTNEYTPNTQQPSPHTEGKKKQPQIL